MALLRVVRFIGLLLTGLAAGIVSAHALEAPGKRRLPAHVYLEVQHNLYRHWGRIVGFIEGAALASAGLAALLSRGRRAALSLALAGSGLVAAMIGVWAAFIRPINRRIESWNLEVLPDDWTRHRNRWEALHRVRALLSVAAFGALIAAAVTDAPPGGAPRGGEAREPATVVIPESEAEPVSVV